MLISAFLFRIWLVLLLSGLAEYRSVWLSCDPIVTPLAGSRSASISRNSKDAVSR